MRTFASFATLSALAGAVAIETKVPDGSHLHADIAQSNLEDFSYEYYTPKDSSRNPDTPSSEFNKQVYHFEENENVFNQASYEARV